jgi:hypothetical protein
VAQVFAEQLNQADRTLEAAGELALCVGSGISRRRLPFLEELIAAALRKLPDNADAQAAFEALSSQQVFSLRLGKLGIVVSDPCKLDEFRALDNATQEGLCKALVQTYGDAFRALETVYPSKQSLLEAIDIERFQTAEPDVPHFFISYLIIEGKISRILTTNWDLLIEKALQQSTLLAFGQGISRAIDEPSWVDRNNGPKAILAKVHGCATQYPLNCNCIVITTSEIQAATAAGWRQDAVHDFLSGPALFCGYSGSDYTLMVPARVVAGLRAQLALPAAQYFVAEDKDLADGARVLNGNDPNRHLRMYAPDMFTSLYFAFLRRRFKQAIETAKQQTQPERAFPKWTDRDWNECLVRVNDLLEVDLPTVLDRAIGLPGARDYDDSVAKIPIRLSGLRQMFLEGRVPQPNSYKPLLFDPIKDIVLLIVLAALVDLGKRRGFSISICQSLAGVTLKETTGAERTICLVHGTYPQSVVPMVKAYLADIESTLGALPTFEVVVIPCFQYLVATDNLLSPGPILSKSLPGAYLATRRFLAPEVLFDSTNFGDLVSVLEMELGV